MLWRFKNISEWQALSYKYKGVFTTKRWLKLPSRIYLGWIKTSVDLREATPLPFLREDELKPNFYWEDLIH